MKTLIEFLVSQLQLLLPSIGLLAILLLLAGAWAWKKGFFKQSDDNDESNSSEGSDTMRRRDDVFLSQLTQAIQDIKSLLQQVITSNTLLAQTVDKQVALLEKMNEARLTSDFQLSEVYKRTISRP